MTRIILALASIALVFSVACGGDDNKDGGILGGGGSSSGGGNTNTKDPVAFAQAALTTTFNVFGGSQDPQKLLDLYLPECRTGVKASDVTTALTMIKAFFPEHLEAQGRRHRPRRNPKVEKNGNDYKLTITDTNKIRVKINGKFVNAEEFFKSIGFDDPSDSPLSGVEEPLMLKEQDGKLFISECNDLQDLRHERPQPPRRRLRAASATADAAAQHRRHADARPRHHRHHRPRRATPTRAGNTPTAANTPTTSGAVVKTTPTAAQAVPCGTCRRSSWTTARARGATQTVCRCMLDILAVRYNVAAYRELEKAISSGQREGELNAIVSACIR